MPKQSLSEYIDSLPSEGRYIVTRSEIRKKLRKSDAAIRLALHRLVKKKRVISPKSGFYVVVPEEYKKIGAPPASWYIDALMKDRHSPYYVGLISAAELYGAAHQQPQEFQVVTDKQYRVITIPPQRIRFFQKRNMQDTPVTQHKTATGFINVSSPEATAFDLVRYYRNVGYYGNVVTILTDLSDVMTAESLVEVAETSMELSVVQRLGHFLELIGRRKLAKPLYRWLQNKSPRVTKLRTDLPIADAELNKRWALYINEDVEAD